MDGLHSAKMAGRQRVARALVGGAGAVAAIGEGSERYDTSRHELYALHRLRERLQRPASQRQDEPTSEDQAGGGSLWLQRETPKFPYVLAMSPADNPAAVARALLGASEHVVGASDQATSAMLDALVVPEAPLDALVQRVAMQWEAFKRTRLHGDVPAAFDPQRRVVAQRLDVVLAALRAAIQSPRDSEGVPPPQDGEESLIAQPPKTDATKLVFFLRDFDDWDDATKTVWFQWIHAVTSAELAHIVVPTKVSVTPTTIAAWQRVHKVPDTDFVAILLRAATRVCDPSSAAEKLRALSQQFALDLRGLDKHTSEDADDVIGYDSPVPPNEADWILDTVGDWWRDLEWICRALEIRGLRGLESDDERLMLVQQVCEEYEREAMLHVLSTLEIFDSAVASNADDTEARDRRVSALQAWKCLEVVTQVADDTQILASPDKLLNRESSKPLNCAHPVEALMPFNQRAHGEAKFLDLIDRGILFLRPNNDVEIGVVPCDAKALVSPCWVETRPLIKRAFEKLWRDDANYTKVLELERFEDNYKMSEEVALFEQEINERRRELDAQTREFIMLQHALKKEEVAQRKAELALIELEIQSKLVYLERLRNLLD